jgi:hypothetical protein
VDDRKTGGEYFEQRRQPVDRAFSPRAFSFFFFFLKNREIDKNGERKPKNSTRGKIIPTRGIPPSTRGNSATVRGTHRFSDQ